jgi:hypothetical protein
MVLLHGFEIQFKIKLQVSKKLNFFTLPNEKILGRENSFSKHISKQKTYARPNFRKLGARRGCPHDYY